MEQMKSSRKCPGCGQWSEWNELPDDKCQHCGNTLDPQGLKARQEQEAEALRQKQHLNLALIEIYPHDSATTRFGKRIVQAAQLTLMAIISFIIWLVTVLAG
jgi:methionyl-tRNA synthetase